jgi:L-alanine-DL-glutamate epimerase-like enolase superfamily enzyme
MKIIAVRVLPFKTSKDAPSCTQGSYEMYNSHVLVALHTDTAFIGYGSASTTGQLCQAAMGPLLPLLADEPFSTPSDIRRLWEKLNRSTQWLGGGAVTAARSAIDIAMWDVLGKQLGKPVWQLLQEILPTRQVLATDSSTSTSTSTTAACTGSVPPHHTEVMAYGSCTMPHTAEEMQRVVAAVAAQGFRAVKIAWGYGGRSSVFSVDSTIPRLLTQQYYK